jgi:hypothetical protein
MTTSHLTNPAIDAEQVIGYSYSTDETTSHLTRLANDVSQVIGYSSPAEELLAGHPKDGNQVAGYS